MTTKTFGFVVERKAGAAIRICVEYWTGMSGVGRPLITPDLVADKEIDWHIDALKADLERVRAAAKVALLKG